MGVLLGVLPPLADRFAQEVAELVEEADELPIRDVLHPLAKFGAQLRRVRVREALAVEHLEVGT